jgi:AcrR family transcriptional regulator
MPRNKYPEETRQLILDAALELFLEKGFEQTTVLDIVDNMGGLTRGAFYHHFKSKDEVLDCVGDRLYYSNNPFTQVEKMKGLTGLEKLRAVLLIRVGADEYGSKTGLEREEYLRLTKSMLNLLKDARFLKGQVEQNIEGAKVVETIVIEGMADGSIREGNSKVLSELLVLLLNFWMLPCIYPTNKEQAIDKLKAIKQMLESLGCPLVDEKLMSHFIEFAEVLEMFTSSD